jgi:hypothetical protein
VVRAHKRGSAELYASSQTSSRCQHVSKDTSTGFTRISEGNGQQGRVGTPQLKVIKCRCCVLQVMIVSAQSRGCLLRLRKPCILKVFDWGFDQPSCTGQCR